MTTASPYSTNIPGHPTEQISKEELRSLLKEVESHPYDSHAYKKFKKWPWQNQKLSKSQLAAKKVEEERLEALRQIGEQLKQVRESQGLTLDKLTMYTYISPNQMAAVENGEIEKLPEDVLIRGFIRIMGNALGLNGANLANSLPISNDSKSILPSWYKNKKPSRSLNMELSSTQLYLGYTALVASAVGGLSIIYDHVNNHKNSQLIAPTLSSLCESDEKATNVNHQSPMQHGRIGNCFGPQISPPEAL